MFEVGDLIIYSAHGVCRIDDISEKTLFGVSKPYYDLHPLSNVNVNLKISSPVDSSSVLMLNLIHKDEALEIIESFHSLGIPWIDHNNERIHHYTDIVNKGNRHEIAKIANTLMRRKQLVELNKKKLGTYDQRMLTSIQNILFNEIAIALETTYEAVLEMATRNITLTQ